MAASRATTTSSTSTAGRTAPISRPTATATSRPRGYNHIAGSNNFIVVYPQAQGSDGGGTQNPDGCWDWWGYTSPTPNRPDYYSRDAIQVKAIHGMLERLGGWAAGRLTRTSTKGTAS
jgi:hypothetical protein